MTVLDTCYTVIHHVVVEVFLSIPEYRITPLHGSKVLKDKVLNAEKWPL